MAALFLTPATRRAPLGLLIQSRAAVLAAMSLFAVAILLAGGCSDDSDAVREIQAQRQNRMQSRSVQDHLGATHNLLRRLFELNDREARRQITYHLNRWQEESTRGKDSEQADITPLVSTYEPWLSDEARAQRVERTTFVGTDLPHLRDSYLARQIVSWVDVDSHDDPLFADWFKSLEGKLDERQILKLKTTHRLFDWCVRNIAYEPEVPTTPAPPAPTLTKGLTFRAPGYRQTQYQTLWRGTGDAWQLAGVFTQLCRQADIPAFILALANDEDGSLKPWSVGVLIGKEIYLYEPELGIPIPRPTEAGIATLGQARSDAAVLRRLNVPGFFDYPYSKSDISQSIALLNVVPEAISPRMKQLQNGLTGERRMITYVDADRLAKEIDDVRGIAGVRLWKVPLQAEVYAEDIAKAAERDLMFQFWYRSRWAILEGEIPSSKQLAKARWQHLHGQFDSIEEENIQGARPLYLTQRAPEFELEDLAIDVELQKAYGIRRQLGTASDIYERQVQQAQVMMRMSKRTATYWISLVQYDDGRYDTSKSWLVKRVLDDEQRSQWENSAVYNAARAAERTGEIDVAMELYKSEKNARPHGSRIRARLLGRTSESTDD
ncbi:hypothetical protein N9N28_01000 [Rubripirellula amarantea]|nr:hypothetical protein [Rubripirellula amarantea]